MNGHRTSFFVRLFGAVAGFITGLLLLAAVPARCNGGSLGNAIKNLAAAIFTVTGQMHSAAVTILTPLAVCTILAIVALAFMRRKFHDLN